MQTSKQDNINAESIKLAKQAKFLHHIHNKMQAHDRQTTERQCKQASKAIEMQNQTTKFLHHSHNKMQTHDRQVTERQCKQANKCRINQVSTASKISPPHT